MQRTIARWGPWATIVALAFTVTAPVTFGGNVLFWGVVAYQFVPWYEAAAAMWRAGALPLWNVWVGGGAPLLANYQVAALYPPTWLMIAIPPARALGWLIAAHLVLTGAGMFAWARARGLSRTAGLIGALALEGCGYLIARAGLFPSIAFTFAWIPVWLWRVERLAQRPDRRRAARLAVVVGLGLLAGHAQTAVYGLVLTGLLLLWRGWTAEKTSRFRLWAWGCAGLALGAGLAAAQLLPTAAYLGASVRSGGLADEALIYSFWPWRLLTFVTPDFFGHPAMGNYVGYPTYWESAGYIGLAPLLLALGSLSRPLKGTRGEARFWVVVGGAALVLAMGKFLPGYEAAFAALPFLRIFNGPARRTLVTEVALAALAAMAVERWLDDRPKRWQALPLLMGIVLAAVGGAMAYALPDLGASARAVLWAGLLLAAWGVLSLLRGKVQRSFLVAGVIGLVFVDLVLWGQKQFPHITPDFYKVCASPALAEAWRQVDEPGRLLFAGTRVGGAEYDVRFGYFRSRDWRAPDGGWTQVCETLLPNLGQLAGVPFADNEDPIRLGRWEALETLAEAHPHLLPLLGVSHRLDESCAAGEVEVASVAEVKLCYAGPAQRAWIVSRARQVDAEAMPAALVDPAFAPREEVLLESAPPLTAAGGGGRVMQLQDSANALTIALTVDGPAYLVIADAWDSGWTARVDGVVTPVLRADLALRAVFIPTAGEHRVTLTYRPLPFMVGAMLSGLALVGVCLFSLLRTPKNVMRKT
jgi:hypothetical protein